MKLRKTDLLECIVAFVGIVGLHACIHATTALPDRSAPRGYEMDFAYFRVSQRWQALDAPYDSPRAVPRGSVSQSRATALRKT